MKSEKRTKNISDEGLTMIDILENSILELIDSDVDILQNIKLSRNSITPFSRVLFTIKLSFQKIPSKSNFFKGYFYR